MNSKTLYALDFDGVICNSAVETALTGWLAAQTLWDDLDGLSLNDEQIRQFVNIRPCLEYGYEALLIVRLLHDNYSLKLDCSNYHEAMQSLIKDNDFNTDALKILFGRTRDAQIADNESTWLASNPLFEGITERLKALNQNDWLIVTTKQERFVEAILKANDIEIDSDRIFGLDRQLSKQQVLQNLLDKSPDRPITFIEDRLPTLLGIKQNPQLASVKLQLVDWGYNTDKEQETAKANGIEVIHLEMFVAG